MKSSTLRWKVLLGLCPLFICALTRVEAAHVAAATSRLERKAIISELQKVYSTSALKATNFTDSNPKVLFRNKRAYFSLLPRLIKWPTPDQIRWIFDPMFPEEHKPSVRLAVSRLNAEFKTCITFIEFANASSIKPDGVNQNDYIIVTDRQGPAGSSEIMPPQLCGTRPGRLLGVRGQHIAIVTPPKVGVTAEALPCLDTRVIMGLFYQMLGFHNEVDRPDRDNHINIFYDRMRPLARQLGVYQRVFGPLEGTPVGLFDKRSITIEPSYFYSATGQDVIEAKVIDRFGLTDKPNLSYLDCVAVMVLYKVRNKSACDISMCTQT